MFVEILNDYDPALFLVKPGSEVIGTTMLSSFIQGMVGPVAALAMVQVAVTVVFLAIGARVFKIGVTGGHDALDPRRGARQAVRRAARTA